MNLIRYNSMLNDFVPVSFSSLVDRFFNDSLFFNGGVARTFVPKADIIENDKAFEIHLAVPGMNKEDIKVDLNDNYLTVSGERKFSNEKKERDYYAVETQYGTFSRSFALPSDIDTKGISAKYSNGILEIRIPKDEKKALKTTIPVS